MEPEPEPDSSSGNVPRSGITDVPSPNPAQELREFWVTNRRGVFRAWCDLDGQMWGRLWEWNEDRRALSPTIGCAQRLDFPWGP